MFTQSAYLYALIIACEAAFWVVLALALVARYVFRRMGLSRVLLFALPVVDLMLLVFTALDLRSGTPATFAHGLATAYVGFTVAFGGLVSRLGGPTLRAPLRRQTAAGRRTFARMAWRRV